MAIVLEKMRLFYRLSKSTFQSLCQLVGAGSTSALAVCTLKPFDDLVNIHALAELCHTLSVSVAAARELDALDDLTVKLNIYLS